jgi:hypothetical protein
VLVAITQLDSDVAWKTYLEVGSLAWFIMVAARSLVKIIFEWLIPALKAAIPFLISLFQSFIDWAKSLNSTK